MTTRHHGTREPVSLMQCERCPDGSRCSVLPWLDSRPAPLNLPPVPPPRPRRKRRRWHGRLRLRPLCQHRLQLPRRRKRRLQHPPPPPQAGRTRRHSKRRTPAPRLAAPSPVPRSARGPRPIGRLSRRVRLRHWRVRRWWSLRPVRLGIPWPRGLAHIYMGVHPGRRFADLRLGISDHDGNGRRLRQCSPGAIYHRRRCCLLGRSGRSHPRRQQSRPLVPAGLGRRTRLVVRLPAHGRRRLWEPGNPAGVGRP